MKISKIDLSWFRGAAELVCLKTDNKSVVIYGDNATGKSSFADGFEFIVTKGKIEHLAHEYKDREHKNCLRNTSASDMSSSFCSVHAVAAPLRQK